MRKVVLVLGVVVMSIFGFVAGGDEHLLDQGAIDLAAEFIMKSSSQQKRDRDGNYISDLPPAAEKGEWDVLVRSRYKEGMPGYDWISYFPPLSMTNTYQHEGWTSVMGLSLPKTFIRLYNIFLGFHLNGYFGWLLEQRGVDVQAKYEIEATKRGRFVLKIEEFPLMLISKATGVPGVFGVAINFDLQPLEADKPGSQRKRARSNKGQLYLSNEFLEKNTIFWVGRVLELMRTAKLPFSEWVKERMEEYNRADRDFSLAESGVIAFQESDVEKAKDSIYSFLEYQERVKRNATLAGSTPLRQDELAQLSSRADSYAHMICEKGLAGYLDQFEALLSSSPQLCKYLEQSIALGLAVARGQVISSDEVSGIMSLASPEQKIQLSEARDGLVVALYYCAHCFRERNRVSEDLFKQFCAVPKHAALINRLSKK